MAVSAPLSRADRAARDGALRAACRDLLFALGEDPDRPGLKDTPQRFAKAWLEFVDPPLERLDTAFEAIETDQLVVLTGLKLYSMCEHHLLPFRCTLTLAYLPRQKVLGASKLARLAHYHASRLQIQERLVADCADTLGALTASPDTACFARGLHLCMAMRGVRSAATFTTSALRGAFKTDPALRAEFFALAHQATDGD